MKLFFVTCFYMVFNKGFAFVVPSSPISRTLAPSTQLHGLSQFAPQAGSLFDNMKTPASIIAGAIVPIGFVSPLSLTTDDGKEETSRLKKSIRQLYSVVAVMSLCSELLTVVWASVASNRLIETKIAPAESVW